MREPIGGARTPGPELARHTSHALAVDLGTPEGPAALAAYALEKLGHLDILVNNVASAVPQKGGFLTVDDELWQTEFDLTFLSAVRTARACLPSLLERRGTVINISSAHARVPLPSVAACSAAKAALTNLSKALSEEFAPLGLRVNTVTPGLVRTGVWTEPGGEGARIRGGAAGPARRRRGRHGCQTADGTSPWSRSGLAKPACGGGAFSAVIASRVGASRRTHQRPVADAAREAAASAPLVLRDTPTGTPLPPNSATSICGATTSGTPDGPGSPMPGRGRTSAAGSPVTGGRPSPSVNRARRPTRSRQPERRSRHTSTCCAHHAHCRAPSS
ncbi:SDR family oxidoreductase [Streptomyces pratensis]|uniref:SDR family oxidoreductase n=1 Tax=Streptomyces pratensis TaxID=1169025 RepID=UPI003017CE18